MQHRLSVRYVYIISIIYTLVAVYSSFKPDWFNWGLSTFFVFSEIGIVILLLSMLIVLIPDFQTRLLQVYAIMLIKYQQQTSQMKTFMYFASLCGFGFCFWFFGQKLHFLGDGNMLARTIPLIHTSTGVFSLYKNSPLTGLVIYAFSLILKEFGIGNYGMLTYQMISILCGILSIHLINKIGKILISDLSVRLMFIIGIIAAAGSQMFFSYIENYSIGIVAILCYIYWSVQYLSNRKHFVFVTLSFIVSSLVHFGMVLIGISYLFLLYKEYSRKRYHSIFISLSLVLVTFLFLYFGVYVKNPKLYLDVFKSNNHLLIYSDPGSADYSYSFLSSFHLIDILNLILFVSPFMILLIPQAVRAIRFRELLKKDTYFFLSLCALGTFFFVLCMKSDLGLSRDWDLYTLFLFPSLIVTVLFVLKSSSADRIMRNSLIIFAITSIHTTAWVSINASQE
jgi:hypothetical protein